MESVLHLENAAFSFNGIILDFNVIILPAFIY